MINLPKLILASGSPRRAEILTAVGWQFTKRVADIDESELPGETPENYVQRLAREKAEAVARLLSEQEENVLVLGADTTVVINDEIIGKPSDFAEAREMLGKLSGNRHDVLTGVALVKVSARQLETRVAFERTSVKFAEMSEAEIGFLVEKGEPLDKAGAYAVQAQAALFIEGIEGDYWNVVGLPVHLVYRLMLNFNNSYDDYNSP
ncbi:MAG: Maf family protein [Acidobacteriota bacterium]|nr:Maf family protein [Acidobacteriota bacterium]